MTVVQTVFTILLLVSSVALIVSVLLQKGDADGINALTGGNSNSFLGKNKGNTVQGKLTMLTKASAIAFVVLGLVLIFV